MPDLEPGFAFCSRLLSAVADLHGHVRRQLSVQACQDRGAVSRRAARSDFTARLLAEQAGAQV